MILATTISANCNCLFWICYTGTKCSSQHIFSLPSNTMNHEGHFLWKLVQPRPSYRKRLLETEIYVMVLILLKVQALTSLLNIGDFRLLVCFTSMFQHILTLCFGRIYTSLNAWLSQGLDCCEFGGLLYPQPHLHHRTCWTLSCYKYLGSKSSDIFPAMYIFRAMWLG